MGDESSLNSATKLREFDTNNYGDRNATYNNNVFHTTYNGSFRECLISTSEKYLSSSMSDPRRPGTEILSGYIAPTALHSSEARNSLTGCLKGTRVAAIGALDRWIEDPSKKHQVCWVHGGAGVGKSAIAQTICESFRRKSQLAASFFLTKRQCTIYTGSLFPTLAYQLATTPALRNAGLSSFIDDSISRNPVGLKEMNLEGEFQTLLFQPCAQVDPKRWKTLPKLVVIDGLDECMGGSGAKDASHAQETLLSIIYNATSASPSLPLIFVIFSRPERTIRNFFKATLLHEVVDIRNYRAQADEDIKRYLDKEFAGVSDSHPELLTIGRWPGEQVVGKLVGKADGHFIYVVTVMKYITANNPSPADLRERLDIVLRTEETSSHPDLSDLDRLYHTILQPFTHDGLREQVLLPILQLIITPHPRDVQIGTPKGRSQHLVAALLQIDIHQCTALLSQLRSVLHVPDERQSEDISILHASFLDFLCEQRRSHGFHIRPLSVMCYLDLLSHSLLSLLAHKVRQHQMREPMELSDPTNHLELWSLNAWTFVRALGPLKPSANNYTPSEKLINAIINFDLYGYVNMLLDQFFLPPENGMCRDGHWRQFLEGDWLIVFPKDKRKRDTSLSRLGSIVLAAAIDYARLSDVGDMLPLTTVFKSSIYSGLEVLPDTDLERARTKLGMDVRLVSLHQRARFAEEVVAEDAIFRYGPTFGKSINTLIDTPRGYNSASEENDRVMVVRGFGAFYRRLIGGTWQRVIMLNRGPGR
ncbi:hypothetical protein AAF712_015272 [Marasmius tenuissimus]|uniref:Nephrocystin 3-like N-terminal domain-containing protein n=1 Tax=Marasmius tenuissimus TaxID=585030 RepID=A0ABR2ZB94_9AGAR